MNQGDKLFILYNAKGTNHSGGPITAEVKSNFLF